MVLKEKSASSDYSTSHLSSTKEKQILPRSRSGSSVLLYHRWSPSLTITSFLSSSKNILLSSCLPTMITPLTIECLLRLPKSFTVTCSLWDLVQSQESKSNCLLCLQSINNHRSLSWSLVLSCAGTFIQKILKIFLSRVWGLSSQISKKENYNQTSFRNLSPKHKAQFSNSLVPITTKL